MINLYLSSLIILSFFTLPFILSIKKNNNQIDLNLLISISSSLYLFFILKFVSFLIGIEISQIHFYFIIFLFSIMSIYLIINDKNIVVDRLTIIIFAIFFILSFFLIFTNMPIFIAWDAVVSWNRWATELLIINLNIVNSFTHYFGQQFGHLYTIFKEIVIQTLVLNYQI